VLLKVAVISSPAWEWIKQLDGKGNGRLAMIKLHDHYNGPDKKRAQISLSEATIEGTYYKNEKALLFENFITKLGRIISSTGTTW
jgi:hypothetical protein